MYIVKKQNKKQGHSTLKQSTSPGNGYIQASPAFWDIYIPEVKKKEPITKRFPLSSFQIESVSTKFTLQSRRLSRVLLIKRKPN